MPRPKRLDQQPIAMMMGLLDKALRERVVLVFATQEEAFNARARIYAFRAAVKREPRRAQELGLDLAQMDQVLVRVTDSRCILENRNSAGADALMAAAAAAGIAPIQTAAASPSPAVEEEAGPSKEEIAQAAASSSLLAFMENLEKGGGNAE